MDTLTPPFEVRYLDIVWSDPDTVIKLTKSYEAIEISDVSSGWQIETTTFPSANHFIGLNISAPTLMHTPYFNLPDGSREELHLVKEPGTGEVWWIQSNNWDRQKSRHLSELYRTAGRVDLVVQNKHLFIDNNTFNFSVTELEHYLADFKNDLWLLILDNRSTATAKVEKTSPDCFDEDQLKYFDKFIAAVEKITDKPAMNLREFQEKLPFRSVRPIPRTFIEFAIQPTSKLLTSRSHRESYDTVENRFIHHCVRKSLLILNKLMKIAEVQNRSYSQMIEQESQWRDSRSSDTKIIDSRVYDNEISKLESDIAGLNKQLSSLITRDSSVLPNGSAEHGTYKLGVGKSFGHSSSTYFVNTLDGIDFKREHGTYLLVEFPKHAELDLILKELGFGEIEIGGRYVKTKQSNSSGDKYYKLEFLDISSIAIAAHPWLDELLRLRERRPDLEKMNWVVPLTSDEREDYILEQNVSIKKCELYEISRQRMQVFLSAAPTLHRRLVTAGSFFEQHKVKLEASCPQSMVFVQNPFYVSAKAQYGKIMASNGLSDSIFNSLAVIDDIGLVNVANLYEKWCLLQIILVLNRIYKYELVEGWQKVLVDAVLKKQWNIPIKFENASLNQRIVLTYEKTLPNNNRPDFVIDLISEEDDAGSASKLVSKKEQRARLVLDAKFKGPVTEAYLRGLVDDLYFAKDYSEGGRNAVFILHPSPNAIQSRTSPLAWGAECDYGQSNNENHTKGSIFLSPSLTNSRSVDNLQRLIGCFLQKQSFILRWTDGNAPPQHNMSCIGCGNTDVESLRVEYKPTKKGSEAWSISCQLCKITTIKTICYSCQQTIFKNGPKWTYHRTRAEQTSNVVCPRCEKFF